jgi:hypothetical protein
VACSPTKRTPHFRQVRGRARFADDDAVFDDEAEAEEVEEVDVLGEPRCGRTGVNEAPPPEAWEAAAAAEFDKWLRRSEATARASSERRLNVTGRPPMAVKALTRRWSFSIVGNRG